MKCTGATVLNISGGSFEDTSSGTAVLISETSSTPVVTITGGTFKSGAGSGYAFNIEYNGDVTISGGTFSKSGPGGAVLNVGRSSSYTANVTVTGGTFYNESSVYANCNVVCVNGGGSIVVTGGTFKNTSNGGSAVYASGGNASLYGGTYINNSSNRAGYTVYANSTANVTIYDGIYENNCTYTGSYTIYTSGNSASSPTVTIYGGDYSSAGSTLIYKYTYATVSVSGGTYSSDVTSYVDTETYTVTSNGDGTYTVGSTATVPSFYGKNIVLGGEIGIKFYVDFTDVSSPESYSVNFIIDGVTTPVVYTSSVEYTGVSGKTIRYYECEVPCWKMGTTIVAQITNGSTIVETSTYSVATYASNVYSSASDKFKNLLDTMLNFGYYAEDYYEDVKGAALSATVGDSAKQSLDSVSETTLSTYDPTVDGDKTKVMATLVLDETCELRFYVDSGYTVSVDGFTLYEGSDDNGTYYAIQDILVQNWDYGFTVTVKDSSDSVVCTLTKYSVMSYAYTVVSGTGYDDSLVNLVKAMYLYNQAANTYLGLN
ncbi:MAG: hypothetical protein LUH18_00210 [Oscillospiraceae bacterium]|nr:hypothetical protein [Oscillospiraceae bacterium]